MENLTIEKLKYLIKGLSGKDVADELIGAALNDNILLTTFQNECKIKAGIPIPENPLYDKYKDIKLYSEYMLAELMLKKFPDGMELHLPGIDVAALHCYMNTNLLYDNNIFYPLMVNQSPGESEKLDVSIHIKADMDEYMHYAWADEHRYKEKKLDEFLKIYYATDDSVFAYRSETTNFIRRHPDLTGGVLIACEPDEVFHHQLTVEGRPFYEALSLVMQKPQMTVPELKELLHDPQMRQQFMDVPRIPGKAGMIVGEEFVYLFQKGVLGCVAIDRYRGLYRYGERLDEKAMDFVKSIIKDKQLVRDDSTLFFRHPHKDYEWNGKDIPFLNLKDGKITDLYSCELADGQKVFAMQGMGEKVVVKEQDMEHMLNLNEHIADMNVYTVNKGKWNEGQAVRCLIDGQQQIGTMMHRSAAENYNKMTDTTEKRNFLLKFLAVEHHDKLMSIGQPNSQGMKL